MKKRASTVRGAQGFGRGAPGGGLDRLHPCARIDNDRARGRDHAVLGLEPAVHDLHALMRAAQSNRPLLHGPVRPHHINDRHALIGG